MGQLKLLKWNVLYDWLSWKRVEHLFDFVFTHLGYRGLLISDLERYLKAGFLRAEWVKRRGQWREQRTIGSGKTILRMGFMGIFGREAIFPREFFHILPENVEVYIYDLIRPEKRKFPYQGTKIFKNLEKVTYRKTPLLRHYMESKDNYPELLKMIEDDHLDVLLFTIHTFTLPLFDRLTVPVILAHNMTSLPTPHLKCRVQSFVQPPWPYEVRNSQIWNLENNKSIQFPRVSAEAFIYNCRATRHFPLKSWNERKTQIYYAGNLKKINSGPFCELLAVLLNENRELRLVYRGGTHNVTVKEVQETFARFGIMERIEYRGRFELRIDKNGNYILDEDVKSAFTDLSESKLFLNTFPISGARSCMEAYALEVPVIHLDAQGQNWLRNQSLVPFRLPMNLTNSGTACSIEEYQAKVQRVLDYPAFAQQIIREQNEILQKLTDPDRFWKILLEMIEKDRKLSLSQQVN